MMAAKRPSGVTLEIDLGNQSSIGEKATKHLYIEQCVKIQLESVSVSVSVSISG